MNHEEVLSVLKRERGLLDIAISALSEDPDNPSPVIGPPPSKHGHARKPGRGKGRHMSTAAKARISAAMKKRWAQRKASNGKLKSVAA
jgi:hypothetical protein